MEPTTPERPPVGARVPVGVLERVARVIDAHADEIIGRSHSEANIAREDGLRAMSRALYASARGETVDWRTLGAEMTTGPVHTPDGSPYSSDRGAPMSVVTIDRNDDGSAIDVVIANGHREHQFLATLLHNADSADGSPGYGASSSDATEPPAYMRGVASS